MSQSNRNKQSLTRLSSAVSLASFASWFMLALMPLFAVRRRLMKK